MEESDAEWEETIRSTPYTNYPICDGSIDNVVGILYTREYFRLLDKTRANVMEKAVRQPYFVPSGAKADVTFRNMKAQRVSFAVVLDEYAGFMGVLTTKDLIEMIVGDMEEEHEEIKEEELQQIDENKWRVNGNVSLAVMAKSLDRDFPDEYDTFSGLVMALYGAVPEEGSQFSVSTEDFLIEVSDVQDHQISRAVITLLEKNKEEEN